MAELTSFDDVYALLEKIVQPSHAMRGAYTLDRMQQLMKLLGHPQNKFKVVHIAGTSGKTSTAYYVAAMLTQTGQKVGLTVSPHIDDVNERVQINMTPLPEKTFCKELTKFNKLIEQSGIKATYFEYLVAFAYWEFARQKVDYAVVEVGLGGLLDGTNMFTQRDKVCVITDIGLDHTEVLGDTIQAITAQKAGIIRPHNRVFMYEQSEKVMEVVREVCEQMQAELHEVWQVKQGELPKNLVLFQRRNWYLAYMVYSYVAKRDKLPELTEEQLAISTTIIVPGRMEMIKVGKKTVILDGAHNTQKMKTLAKSIQNRFPKQKVAVMFGLVQSKNFKMRTRLQYILGLVDYAIITKFDTQSDLQRKAVDPLKIAEHCVDLGYESIDIIKDPIKAYRALLKRPEPILLVTGSFYLLNHIRPLLHKGRTNKT